MPIEVKKFGLQADTKNMHEAFRASLQSQAHYRLAQETPITNNSGGSEGTVSEVAAFINEAASGSDLADTTTTDSALDTVHDALAELYDEANSLASKLGLEQVTYNGGGASPDGTVDAITTSVTGAATGAQATEMNTVRAAFDDAFYQLANMVNDLSRATGLDEMTIDFNKPTSDTIAAITIDTGSAADPGVKKTNVDAALATWQENVKTIAEKLIDLTTEAAPLVVAQ